MVTMNSALRLLERNAGGAERTLDLPVGEGFRAAPGHT